jgi:hypothetical protein
MKIRLWLVKETEKARQYSKTPPGREQDLIWIPRSVMNGQTKQPDGECMVEIEDWFCEKNDL